MNPNIERIFGPCLSHQELEEPICDLYDMAVDMVKEALSHARILEGGNQHPYPCVVGFPEKLSFNAGTCDLEGEGSIVAINAAVPYLLFCACYIYSSRSDIRSGLPVEENGKLLVYDSCLELLGRMPQMPTCAADYSNLFEQLCSSEHYQTASFGYTLFLYSIAIRFLVMHEVMHIVLGHTAYAKQKLQLNQFMEFSSARETTANPEFFHCLEFIADRHAIRGIARKMILGDPYFSAYAQEELTAGASVDVNTYLLRGIVTAATVMFHLFPSLDETMLKPVLSHPHPYLRSQWLAMELGHELKSECDLKQAIWVPLAYTAATLSANFKCPGNWRSATELDQMDGGQNQQSITDRAYQDVVQNTQQWSSYIYKNYGPKFIDGEGIIIP